MNKECGKIRNSSIELLKIVGLILITLSHAIPCYGDKNAISYIDNSLATSNINEFAFIIFGNLGQVGNLLFIMCSAYFLINKNNVKINKIAYILSDCFIISVISLIIHLLLGVDISIKEMLVQFFPTTFNNNWFVGCYILLYIIHPFLNKIIISLDKKELLRINIFFIMAYCGVNMIISGSYYYNNLIGFIVIYFIVAYNKLYLQNFGKNKKRNIQLFLISSIMFVGLLITTNIIGLNIKVLSNKMLQWNSIMNIFGILMSIALLNLFSNKYFENKIINYISSLSLLFYLIHANALFSFYTKPLFYQFVFPLGGNIVLWVILETILLFVCGIIMSAIYKKVLQRLIHKIADQILNRLYRIWNKTEKVLLKLN